MKQAFALLGKLGSFTGWGASGGGEGFIDIRRGSDPQTTWQNNPHGKENTNQNKCILQEAIRISLFDSPSQPIQAHL